MKAVILAAGEGNRMRPLTNTRPKVMVPIANRPILEHLMLEAMKAGIREFLLIVGYHDEQVRHYFGGGEKWGVSIEYCTQRRQLGTADAFRMADGIVKDKFLGANGDIMVSSNDIASLVSCDETTMGVVAASNPKDLGVVEMRNGRIVRIYEKMENPPIAAEGALANTGLYLFTPEVFDAIRRTAKSPRGEFEITDSLQMLMDERGGIACRRMDSWLDISYPWDVLRANQVSLKNLESQNQGTVEANVTLQGPVSIGKGSRIRSGAYIIGPVVIGENCDIGPNCFIRPSTSIGDNCHVGAAVEVKNSIIMNGSKVPHLNYVGDSIIGENCNLGAGTKVANLRLDKKNVRVDGRDTGMRKLGVIMGDGVETGINSSINVGSLIGNKTMIGPGAVATGIISSESKIF